MLVANFCGARSKSMMPLRVGVSLGGRYTFIHRPWDPGLQLVPTLGLKVYKRYLLWAV